MRHLAPKHKARLRFDQDVAQAVLHPNWLTPFSVAAELIGEARGFRLFT